MLTKNARVFWVKISKFEFVLFVKCQRLEWNNLSKGVILPNLDSCRFEQNWLMEMSVFHENICVFFHSSVDMECGKFMEIQFFQNIAFLFAPLLSLFLFQSVAVGNLWWGKFCRFVFFRWLSWNGIVSKCQMNTSDSSKEFPPQSNEWTRRIWSNRSNVIQVTTNR